MKNQNTTVVSKGLGLGTLVFLVFLTLKLAEVGRVATWSWWAVTAPLWVPALLTIAVIIVIAIFWVIGSIISHYSRK